jgi:hypothetical protein
MLCSPLNKLGRSSGKAKPLPEDDATAPVSGVVFEYFI